MMDAVIVKRSHRTDETLEKVRNMAHADRSLSIRAMTMQLNLDKETVMCVGKGMNFGPTSAQSSTSQGALCQAVSGPKIDY